MGRLWLEAYKAERPLSITKMDECKGIRVLNDNQFQGHQQYNEVLAIHVNTILTYCVVCLVRQFPVGCPCIVTIRSRVYGKVKGQHRNVAA